MNKHRRWADDKILATAFVDFIKVAILCQYELECLENCKIKNYYRGTTAACVPVPAVLP